MTNSRANGLTCDISEVFNADALKRGRLLLRAAGWGRARPELAAAAELDAWAGAGAGAEAGGPLSSLSSESSSRCSCRLRRLRARLSSRLGPGGTAGGQAAGTGPSYAAVGAED